MQKTRIEWVRGPNGERGYTWNPCVGCRGEGCAVYDVCYARRTAKRFKKRCQSCYEFKPHLHPERLSQPYKVKKPSGIFVCSMADLFGSGVDAVYNRVQVLKAMAAAYWHRYYILTKQPQNAKNYTEYPDNVWIGVTVNRRSDLWRLDELRRINARVKFVSFEPLCEDLGEIDLTDVRWVIVGAQTRPNKQPDVEWLNSVLRVAHSREIPVFLKNNLGLAPLFGSGPQQEFPKV